MDLKSLPAIAALERVVKTLKLTPDDQKRCHTLVKLLKTSADGRLRYDTVLDAVFPGDHRPTNPKNVFTKFRQRVAAAALESGETFSIDVSGSKRSTTAAMLVTFTGDDAAAGSLTLPANPHYRIADYAEQRAALPIKPIFLSNADADATLVADFLNCLNTTLSSDPDERVRDWAHASWWHRKDLNQNLPHETMQRAIDECSVGILLFSRDFVASSYVRDEELPRFDPRKLQNADTLARDAIAVRLTAESVSKIHEVVGHEAFQLIGWVSPDSKVRLSFEESSARQRENICDKVVAELKRILLPKPTPKSPPKAKRRFADRDASTSPPDDHHLQLPPHKDYPASDYDDAQSATTGRVLRAGTSNLLQLQPSPDAEDARDDAQPSKQANVAALAHLKAWAMQPTSTRWFAVLGELGMGKTYLCRMLECHLKDDKTAPRPIYIDLKASADDAAANRALTLESIIGNSLRADYNQPKHITVDTVLDWVRKQGAIAIFDGLDELAVHLKDEGTRALITELLRVLPPRAEPTLELGEAKTKKKKARPVAPENPGKAVISCRTHYFPDIASESAFLLQAHRGTMNQDDVESFTLLPFTEEAIRRFFTQALGAASADHAFELISAVHNLRELAERPYLLRLITAQIDRLEDFRKRGQTVNAATLYGLFAADWLQRDTGKHEFDASDKPTVMQALAAEMWREGARQWSHARLKTWLYTLIERTPGWGFRYGAKADVLAKDLRTATFLVRAGESDFRFAHTSLQEYFLSGYLLDALLDGVDSAATRWQGLAPSSETVDFMWQRWALLDAASQRCAIDAFRTLLALRPSDASSDKPSATAPFSAWLKFVSLQRDNPAAEVNVAGIMDGDFVVVGSADRPLRLPALNLDAAHLPGAQLTHVKAPRLHAIKSDLRQSRWADVDVSHAQFDGANLRGSYWQNVSLRDAVMQGAAFDGALLQGCDLSGVTLPLSAARSSLLAWLNPQSAPTYQGFQRIDVPAHLCAIIATGHSGEVRSVAFSPDGQTLASGSMDSTVKLWDVSTGREKASLAGHKNSVYSVAFSPDGQTLASGSMDSTVKLWDLNTGREKASLAGHKDSVWSVAFSPDGQTLASGSEDNTIKLWDVNTGREKASLAAHKSFAMSVAFSPDGQTLASGSMDSTVKLWDVSTGREKASLAGHKNSVWSVAFSPDGQTLASGSADNTVKLWEVATGREQRSHLGLPRGAWVTFDSTADESDEGELPVVASSDNAPAYLRQRWRHPTTGELAWMPWVPPGTELWVKYQ